VLAFRQLFLVVGVIIAAAAVFVGRYLQEPRDPTSREKVSIAAPLRWALGEPRVRVALGGLLVSMAAISMTMPIFPLYVEDLIGTNTDPKVITGIGFATVAGFTMIGSVFLGRLAGRVGLKVLLSGSLIVAALAMALHPLVSGVAPMLVVRALLGISAAGIGPVLHAMVARAAPEAMRGGITGLASAATILGFFVGPVSGGWLANQFGVMGVFRIAASLAAACGVAAMIAARRVGVDRRIDPVPEAIPR
jgi:DHA1 family multidrug resistance protein-like MFS transporter